LGGSEGLGHTKKKKTKSGSVLSARKPKVAGTPCSSATGMGGGRQTGNELAQERGPDVDFAIGEVRKKGKEREAGDEAQTRKGGKKNKVARLSREAGKMSGVSQEKRSSRRSKDYHP